MSNEHAGSQWSSCYPLRKEYCSESPEILAKSATEEEQYQTTCHFVYHIRSIVRIIYECMYIVKSIARGILYLEGNVWEETLLGSIEFRTIITFMYPPEMC
jgi:hypothetical protein